MGDFYEVFFEDAIIDKPCFKYRPNKKLADYDIPMAGIPHHTASNYVDKLTEQGYKVAVCEQVEPKLAKGVVQGHVAQVSAWYAL